MQSTGRLTSIGTILQSLVHPSASADDVTAARHRAFIGGHLVSGMAALAALPACLAFAGRPSMLQVVALAWLAAPLAVAFFLSQTGRQGAAHLLSSLCLGGLVISLAATTGGLGSFALVWLIVVPLEAALSGSRRIIAESAGIALAALVGLAAAQGLGLLPAATDLGGGQAWFAGLVAAGAVAYAGGLAVTLHRLGDARHQTAREGEVRYRLLADNVSDVITRHISSGGVTFASSAARRLFGTAPVDLLGNGLFERVHVADRPAYLRAFSVAHSEQRPVTVEFRVRAEPQGEAPVRAAYAWMETRVRPLVTDSGESDGLIAVTRDIGERREHEGALLEAREEAERASAAKSRFLASMSHELRTPLNAIIGFSEILAGDVIEDMQPERRREYARIIHDSGSHLLQVVNDILDVSRIEAGSFPIVAEPFDMSDLVQGCCRMMHGQVAQAGLILVTDVEPGLPEIVADKRACRQILLNLMSNAVKFTEPGGRVTVALALSGRDIVLSVADTGVGIAENDLPRLGAPFVQADSSYDRRYEGAGLGLSVVKGLVSLHKGDVAISSALGRGTKVAVSLPRCRGDEAETGQERLAPQRQALRA